MKKLHLGTKTSLNGTKKNIGKEKVYKDVEQIDLKTNAEKMAKIAQKKIEGKTLVAHPTLKNTWIYQ